LSLAKEAKLSQNGEPMYESQLGTEMYSTHIEYNKKLFRKTLIFDGKL